MFYLLPDFEIPEWPLEIIINIWFNSKASDIDNIIKPFLDILSKKYGFNDNRIYKMYLEKEIVAKWSEYIEFSIRKYKKDLHNLK